MQLEQRLLQLHLHFRLYTWFQWIVQKQLQEETRFSKFSDLVLLILEILRYFKSTFRLWMDDI